MGNTESLLKLLRVCGCYNGTSRDYEEKSHSNEGNGPGNTTRAEKSVCDNGTNSLHLLVKGPSKCFADNK